MKKTTPWKKGSLEVIMTNSKRKSKDFKIGERFWCVKGCLERYRGTGEWIYKAVIFRMGKEDDNTFCIGGRNGIFSVPYDQIFKTKKEALEMRLKLLKKWKDEEQERETGVNRRKKYKEEIRSELMNRWAHYEKQKKRNAKI